MPTAKKMAFAISSFFKRNAAPADGMGFQTAPEGTLFTKCDPAVDGDDCLHDCESCTIKYPAKFSIDEKEKLYGHVNGWATHLLVATGKTDWVRDVADEKGSVMEAVGNHKAPKNGKLMLSASNIPVTHHDSNPYAEPTRCLLLPAFVWIDNVSPSNVPQLIDHISSAPTNTSPLGLALLASETSTSEIAHNDSEKDEAASNGTTRNDTANVTVEREILSRADKLSLNDSGLSSSVQFPIVRCQHEALILLCSQKTRDARCGQSAPLLRKEFERHLRPLGLYRDMQDERPGGVGIYFISHVGGHKFSANVMIYRRSGFGIKTVTAGGSAMMAKVSGAADEAEDHSASQCIWLARVRPEDCEGIVKYTVLQGKLVKPERQLRGGFDRVKGLVSW